MSLNWVKTGDKLDGGSVLSITVRAKIPGGWLVKPSFGSGGGITFVPDPNHEWDGNSQD